MNDRKVAIATTGAILIMSSLSRADRAASRAMRSGARRDLRAMSSHIAVRASEGLAVVGVFVGGAALAWALIAKDAS
jgi:hypothetical protein